MSVTIDKIMSITKNLYPTGRAFSWGDDSVIGKIHKALADSEKAVLDEGDKVLVSILADSDDFTEEMAALWEKRLAIDASTSTSLEDRKKAILTKYAAPSGVLARQHYLYIENQLQSAGFDVYVHENRPVAQSPSSFPNLSVEQLTGLGTFQLGQYGLGAGTPTGIVANYVEIDRDSQFSFGTDYRHIFFIGGQIKGDSANVPLSRRAEFRKLILLLKPLHTVGVYFVNFT